MTSPSHVARLISSISQGVRGSCPNFFYFILLFSPWVESAVPGTGPCFGRAQPRLSCLLPAPSLSSWNARNHGQYAADQHPEHPEHPWLLSPARSGERRSGAASTSCRPLSSCSPPAGGIQTPSNLSAEKRPEKVTSSLCLLSHHRPAVGA